MFSKSIQSTLTGLFAAVVLVFSLFSSISQAELTCSKVFGTEATSLPIPAITGAVPVEIMYKGQQGQQRFFKDGNLFEFRNGQWVHFGVGTYQNGMIYEYNIQISVQGPNYGQQQQQNNYGYQNQQTQQNYGYQQQQYQQPRYPDLRPLKNFQYNVSLFHGDRYYENANRSYPSLIHVVQIGNHKLEVILPRNSGYDHIGTGVLKVISELPLKRIEALQTITINWADSKNDPEFRQRYKNFTNAAATAYGAHMNIFPVSLSHFANANGEALKITRHELGHHIASQLFNSSTPSNHYISKAQKDPNSVSEYGNNSWAEDFAEAVELYLRTDAGKFSPHLRSQIGNRFSFLDDIFAYRNPQSVVEPENTTRPKLEVHVAIVEDQILAIAPEIGVGILIKID